LAKPAPWKKRRALFEVVDAQVFDPASSLSHM
jgi:hypothetical protein